MLSYYEILQVEENASSAEIKSAYRKLCKILHPDLHDNTKEANVIFNLLHEAYETLSDTKKRDLYNPGKASPSIDQFTIKKYNEMISRYQDIVEEYEKIVEAKNLKERELEEQIYLLKQEKYQNDWNSVEENQQNIENQGTEMNSKQSEGHTIWSILSIVLLIAFILGLLLLIVLVPAGWWIIIGFVVAFIWAVYTFLKNLF
jgi:curved DNA-binding protein CbpA